MRQEAEDRKALAEEKKKIEAEETKYNNEIQSLKDKLAAANSEEVNLLQARILELESQLSDVAVKKTVSLSFRTAPPETSILSVISVRLVIMYSKLA